MNLKEQVGYINSYGSVNLVEYYVNHSYAIFSDASKNLITLGILS